MSEWVTAPGANQVLLMQPPRDVSDVLSTVVPPEQLHVFAGQIQAGLTVEDHQYVVRLFPGSEDDELFMAAGVSPLRDEVEPSAEQHVARAVVEPAQDLSLLEAQPVLARLTRRICELGPAVAVWAPHQLKLTSDVLFQADVEERPSRTWHHLHTMWRGADADCAHAFTRGLATLGGQDLQVDAAGPQPAQLREQLQETVCQMLEEGHLPEPGDRVWINDRVHEARPGGVGLIDGLPTLDLLPLR